MNEAPPAMAPPTSDLRRTQNVFVRSSIPLKASNGAIADKINQRDVIQNFGIEIKTTFYLFRLGMCLKRPFYVINETIYPRLIQKAETIRGP